MEAGPIEKLRTGIPPTRVHRSRALTYMDIRKAKVVGRVKTEEELAAEDEALFVVLDDSGRVWGTGVVYTTQ